MSKSAPDKLEAGDGDLRTVEAFRRETPRLRAWLRRNAVAWQSVDDLLQDLFLELVLANRNPIASGMEQSIAESEAHEIDGLSIAEIAQRDGIGINTALARKRYAVLHLRKKLAPFQERYFTD